MAQELMNFNGGYDLCKLRSLLSTFPNSTNVWCGCFQMAQELMHFNGGYDSIDRAESSKWIMLCKEVFWQNSHRKEVIPAALQFASSLPADVIYEQFKYVFCEIVDMFILNPNSDVIQALSILMLNVILQASTHDDVILISQESIVRSDADGVTPISCDTLYKLIKSICDTLAVTLVTSSIGTVDMKISIVSSSMLFLSHIVNMALHDRSVVSVTETPKKRNSIMKLLQRLSSYIYPVCISVLKNSLCNKIDICLYSAINTLYHVCIAHDSGLLTICTLVESDHEKERQTDSNHHSEPDFSGILLLCRTVMYIIGEKKKDVALHIPRINQTQSKSSWLKLLDDNGNSLSCNGITYYNDLMVLLYRIIAVAVVDPNVIAFVFQENIDVNGGKYILELQYLVTKRYEQLVTLRDLTIRQVDSNGCSVTDNEADQKFMVTIQQLYETCIDNLNEHNPCIGSGSGAGASSTNPFAMSDIPEDAPFTTNPKLIPYYSIDVDIGAYVMAQAENVQVTPVKHNSGESVLGSGDECISGTPRSINGYMNKLVASISPLSIHTTPMKGRSIPGSGSGDVGQVAVIRSQENANSGADVAVALSYNDSASEEGGCRSEENRSEYSNNEGEEEDAHGPVTSLLSHYEALLEEPDQQLADIVSKQREELQQQNVVIMNLHEDLEHQSSVIFELEEELGNQVKENHKYSSQLKEKVVFQQEDDRQREELDQKNEQIMQLQAELEYQTSLVSELKIDLSSQTMKNNKLSSQLKDSSANESNYKSKDILVNTQRQELEEQEAIITNLQNEIKKHSATIAKQKETLFDQNIQNETYKRQLEEISHEKEETVIVASQRTAVEDALHSKIADLNIQLEYKASRVGELEEEISRQTMQADKQNSRQMLMQQESIRQAEEIKEQQNVIENLESKVSIQSSVLEGLKEELEHESLENEQLKKTTDSLIQNDETSALTMELHQKNEIIEALNRDLSDRSITIVDLQESLVSQAKQMTKISNQLEEQEDRLQQDSKHREELACLNVQLEEQASVIVELESKLSSETLQSHQLRETIQRASGDSNPDLVGVLQEELDQKNVLVMQLNTDIAEQSTTISVLQEELARQTNQTSKYSRQLKERAAALEEDVLVKEELARQSMQNALLGKHMEEKTKEAKLMGHKLRKYKIEVKRLLKKTSDLTEVSAASQEQTRSAMNSVERMNETLVNALVNIKELKASNNALRIESNSTKKELIELKSVLDRAAQISNEVTHVVEHNLVAIGAMETELPVPLSVEKKKNRYQMKLGTPVPPVPHLHTPVRSNTQVPGDAGHRTADIPSTPSAVTDTVMSSIIAVMIEVGSGITMHHRDGTMYTSTAQREQAFFDTGIIEESTGHDQSWSPVALDVVQEMSVLLTVLYTSVKDTVSSGAAPHHQHHPAYNEHIPCGTIRKFLKSGLIPDLVDEKRLKISDVDIIIKKVCGKQQHVTTEEFAKIVIYATRRRYCKILDLTLLVAKLMDSLHGGVNHIMREKGQKRIRLKQPKSSTLSKSEDKIKNPSGNPLVTSQPVIYTSKIQSEFRAESRSQAEYMGVCSTDESHILGVGTDLNGADETEVQHNLSDLMFSDDSSDDGPNSKTTAAPVGTPVGTPVPVDYMKYLISEIHPLDLKSVKNILKVERRSLRTLFTHCCNSASNTNHTPDRCFHNETGGLKEEYLDPSVSVNVAIGGLTLNGFTQLLRRVGLLQKVEDRIPVSTAFEYSMAYYSWIELEEDEEQYDMSSPAEPVCYRIQLFGSAASDLDTHLTFTQFQVCLLNIAHCCYHHLDTDELNPNITKLASYVVALLTHMNEELGNETQPAFRLKYDA